MKLRSILSISLALFGAEQNAIAAGEKSTLWFYQAYNNGPTHGGYMELDEQTDKPTVQLFVEGMNSCYQGVLSAKVNRSDATTEVELTPTMSTCEPVRLILKNDGTGGQRETKKGASWVWDRTERGLTKIIKTTPETLSADIAAAKQKLYEAYTSTQPRLATPVAADVPASCAPFAGGWVGTWSGFGQTWLRVVEIDSNCVAKFSHRTDASVPKAFQLAQVKQGVLSFTDFKGNIDSFSIHGNELWARHEEVNAANTTVFRRVPPDVK